jgi:hypothetical protein
LHAVAKATQVHTIPGESDSAESTDTHETPPGPGIVAPLPKRVVVVTYIVTKDQEIGIATWLSDNDWLWKQGVSILFIILFICIYLYVYNWYSA